MNVFQISAWAEGIDRLTVRRGLVTTQTKEMTVASQGVWGYAQDIHVQIALNGGFNGVEFWCLKEAKKIMTNFVSFIVKRLGGEGSDPQSLSLAIAPLAWANVCRRLFTNTWYLWTCTN